MKNTLEKLQEIALAWAFDEGKSMHKESYLHMHLCNLEPRDFANKDAGDLLIGQPLTFQFSFPSQRHIHVGFFIVLPNKWHRDTVSESSEVSKHDKTCCLHD